MERKLLYGMIAFAVLVPLLIMIWNPALGASLLIIGLIMVARAGEVLKTAGLESLHKSDDALYARRNQGRIIEVPLVDDNGNELEPAVTEQRLEEARAKAGPRDTVVGVRRRPDRVGPKRR